MMPQNKITQNYHAFVLSFIQMVLSAVGIIAINAFSRYQLRDMVHPTLYYVINNEYVIVLLIIMVLLTAINQFLVMKFFRKNQEYIKSYLVSFAFIFVLSVVLIILAAPIGSFFNVYVPQGDAFIGTQAAKIWY